MVADITHKYPLYGNIFCLISLGSIVRHFCFVCLWQETAVSFGWSKWVRKENGQFAVWSLVFPSFFSQFLFWCGTRGGGVFDNFSISYDAMFLSVHEFLMRKKKSGAHRENGRWHRISFGSDTAGHQINIHNLWADFPSVFSFLVSHGFSIT